MLFQQTFYSFNVLNSRFKQLLKRYIFLIRQVRISSIFVLFFRAKLQLCFLVSWIIKLNLDRFYSRKILTLPIRFFENSKCQKRISQTPHSRSIRYPHHSFLKHLRTQQRFEHPRLRGRELEGEVFEERKTVSDRHLPVKQSDPFLPASSHSIRVLVQTFNPCSTSMSLT